MKSTFSMSVSALTLLAALAVPVRLTGQEVEQRRAEHLHHYNVNDLGTLGGSYSEAFFLNKRGAVGGVTSRADGTEHAFLWQKGGMADLGTLGGPNSIAYGGPNFSNQLVGQSDTDNLDPNGEDFCGFGTHDICRPFLWQPLPFEPGVMIPLPTLGGNNGEANGINDLGEIVGTAESTEPDTSCPTGQSLHQFKPVIWWNNEIRKLHTLRGDPDGVAMGTNDNGDVVGASGECGPYNPNLGTNLVARHALLWKKGTVTDLGNLGGTGHNTGILALNVNDEGMVVGVSDTKNNASFHAFLWTRETGMLNLGTLHSDDIGSSATGLDDKGNVAGLSIDASGTPHAFLRPKGEKMIDLNTLIPSDSPLFLLQACSINSRGELTGLAVQLSTGDVHAFLATPIRDAATESYSPGVGRPPALTQDTRKLLQQRLSLGRFGVPLMGPQ